MDKDWFPLCSLLFWCATKVVGLVELISGLSIVIAVLRFGEGWFFGALLPFAVHIVIGGFLLVTDTVYDVATAGMRGRQKSS
jgi:hypothetical protein